MQKQKIQDPSTDSPEQGQKIIQVSLQEKPEDSQLINVNLLTLKINRNSKKEFLSQDKYNEQIKRLKDTYGNQYTILTSMNMEDVQLVVSSKEQKINLRLIENGQTHVHHYYGNKNNLFVFNLLPNIQFSQLKHLSLQNIGISNIESLEFIKAPNIVCIELYDNDIRNLNPLNKSHIPSLQVLTLYGNPIKKLIKFERGNFKKLTQFELDSRRSRIQYNTYEFLFKLPSQNIRKLHMRKVDRIIPTPIHHQVYKINENVDFTYVGKVRRLN